MVLGPAQLTNTSIKSASARSQSGSWFVLAKLTGSGSLAWDAIARKQFHSIVAIDLDGEVVSDSLVQPTLSVFHPFGGEVQISGGFTKAQAMAMAIDLKYPPLPVKLDRLDVLVDGCNPITGACQRGAP
jgi:preprotein translocase subunit SecD